MLGRLPEPRRPFIRVVALQALGCNRRRPRALSIGNSNRARQPLWTRRHLLYARDLLGHTVGLLQQRKFLPVQHARLPRSQSLVRYSGKTRSRKPHDQEPGCLAHSADLLISPLADGDFKPGSVLFVANDRYLCGKSPTILQLHPLRPPTNVVGVHDAANLHHVGFGDTTFGMEHGVGELSVVSREQYSARCKIETSNGEESATQRSKVVSNCGPPFRIAQRGHNVARLVQHDVDEVFSHEPTTIDFNAIGARVRARTKFSDHPSVYANPARGNE